MSRFSAVAVTIAPSGTYHLSAEAASASGVINDSAYRQSKKEKSNAYSDLLSSLRDHFLFDDFSTIETWLRFHQYQYLALFSASEQVDLIFGSGRSKWLAVIEDWEGTRVLGLEVEFGGSGEEASKLCRRFVAEWLIHQAPDIRQSIDLGVRFA